MTTSAAAIIVDAVAIICLTGCAVFVGRRFDARFGRLEARITADRNLVVRELGRMRVVERDREDTLNVVRDEVRAAITAARWQGYEAGLYDANPPKRQAPSGGDVIPFDRD